MHTLFLFIHIVAVEIIMFRVSQEKYFCTIFLWIQSQSTKPYGYTKI